VGDDDIAEWMRRQPDTTHVVVDGAGHSIQGDQPIEMARLIGDLLATPGRGQPGRR
jgi:pimeloyl-ACP methyl ester carboxylesterase